MSALDKQLDDVMPMPPKRHAGLIPMPPNHTSGDTYRPGRPAKAVLLFAGLVAAFLYGHNSAHPVTVTPTKTIIIPAHTITKTVTLPGTVRTVIPPSCAKLITEVLAERKSSDVIVGGAGTVKDIINEAYNDIVGKDFLAMNKDAVQIKAVNDAVGTAASELSDDSNYADTLITQCRAGK